MRGAPFGLRLCKVRNLLRMRGCRERPMCRSASGGMLLVNGYTVPYTSAEIPPAGAPSGFDSAAVLHFIACFLISVPLRSE